MIEFIFITIYLCSLAYVSSNLLAVKKEDRDPDIPWPFVVILLSVVPVFNTLMVLVLADIKRKEK